MMRGMQMPHAEILEAEGTQHLVVTHKSILRALLCVALNLPSTSFRAFDIHNAGVCTFRCAIASCPVPKSPGQSLPAEAVSGTDAKFAMLATFERGARIVCCCLQAAMECSAPT